MQTQFVQALTVPCEAWAVGWALSVPFAVINAAGAVRAAGLTARNGGESSLRCAKLTVLFVELLQPWV